MTKEEITIPYWLLERIEDTLRIQYNINLDEKTGETCQDRNIKESLNGVRKLLRGEELTGAERLEKLQPSIPTIRCWAVRDKGKKELWLHGKRPIRGKKEWLGMAFCRLSNDIFPELKWKDEPKEVKLIIKPL